MEENGIVVIGRVRLFPLTIQVLVSHLYHQVNIVGWILTGSMTKYQ